MDILGDFGDIPGDIGNILDDGLLQNITRQAIVDRKTPSKRRRFSLIRNSKDDYHAGSILRPGKEIITIYHNNITILINTIESANTVSKLTEYNRQTTVNNTNS